MRALERLDELLVLGRERSEMLLGATILEGEATGSFPEVVTSFSTPTSSKSLIDVICLTYSKAENCSSKVGKGDETSQSSLFSRFLLEMQENATKEAIAER